MSSLSAPASDAPRILLVDDSPDDLRLLAEMMRVERFRFTVAGDGRSGYQRAVVVQPDLILMDVTMPQMDGFTAARLLKLDPATQHIPVIFLTSHNAPEERLQGFRLGGVDYVSKPFIAEEVIARIHVHLNRIRGSVAEKKPDAEPTVRDQDEVLAGAAAGLIQDNLENPPAVPEIARQIGTHEKRLRQIFRKHFGMTLSTFIREERIRIASQLLRETDMAVHKIAEQVGFCNARNLATAFRERLGASPTEYRQALAAQPEEP